MNAHGAVVVYIDSRFSRLLLHAGDGYRAVVVFDANQADSSPIDPRSAYALKSQLFFTDDCPVKGPCVSSARNQMVHQLAALIRFDEMIILFSTRFRAQQDSEPGSTLDGSLHRCRRMARSRPKLQGMPDWCRVSW